MSDTAAAVAAPSLPSVPDRPTTERTSPSRRLLAAMPTWALIATKQLELRKRRGLMIMAALLTVGFPVLILGFRLVFHAVDAKSYGPAGSPGVFQAICEPMAEFGFIIAATIGATVGTTDLTEGVFRHLVVTGRSRRALTSPRIPAGLSIILPLVAVAFTLNCLVTAYAGTPQPTSVVINGYSIPAHLDEGQLEAWIVDHPGEAAQALLPVLSSGSGPTPDQTITRQTLTQQMSTIDSAYLYQELSGANPAPNEMVKIGLWLELEVGIGFMVGLGLGSLIGQRTVSTILMIVLEIIITPILSAHEIPYFLDGQRLVVGVAMEQLRPAYLASPLAGVGGGRPGHLLFGGRGALGIPPMPTWAMIAVIVGWIVGWSVIGAWRMMTRDA